MANISAIIAEAMVLQLESYEKRHEQGA